MQKMSAILFLMFVASWCNVAHPVLEERYANNFVNSGISINYVKNWGLKEGLRELIQNMLDGMVSYILDENGHKSQLLTKIIEYNEPSYYREYEFIWASDKDNKQYHIGSIKYDILTEKLTLINPGVISEFNLLLGGSGNKKKENNNQIIGQFGEGMKLAAIALLRDPLQKSLHFYTNNKQWTFKVDGDPNFINDNGEPEKCLFYHISPLSAKVKQKVGYKDGWTYQVIRGITIKEWNDNIKHFTFLQSQQELMAIRTTNDCKFEAEILLSENMKGRLFIKDIHVRDYDTYNDERLNKLSSLSGQKMYYGFNMFDLQLDRDRNSVLSIKEQNRRISCILVDLLAHWKVHKNKYPLAIDELDDLWFNVYRMLRLKSPETSYFDNCLNSYNSDVRTSIADRIWNYWKADNIIDHVGQPILYQSNFNTFLSKNFIKNKRQGFYLYSSVPWNLYYALSKSSNYQSYQSKLSKIKSNAKIYELNHDENIKKNQLIKRITAINSEKFSARHEIVFKDYSSLQLIGPAAYMSGNKIYLDKELLKNEQRMFSQCMKVLNIDMDDIAKHIIKAKYVSTDQPTLSN